MSHKFLRGLFAATYSPFDKQEQLALNQVGPIVDHLRRGGVSGLYVCGTTGEGISMTVEERQTLLEAYREAAAGELTVAVQVGHNCLHEARQLARHAQKIGADIISANAPSYFKCRDVDTLIDCMAMIASAAPDLPFYYYHIPSMTGVMLDMIDFLDRGSKRIPNLVGLKFTETDLARYQTCLEFQDGRFDILWGCDEMLLSAMATGAHGAIGSTYNIAAPLYDRIVNAFQTGNWELARSLQYRSVSMVNVICRYALHPAMKEVLKMLGFDFGTCRLPQKRLQPEQVKLLRQDLEEIGFFEWAQALEKDSTEEGQHLTYVRPPHFQSDMTKSGKVRNSSSK